MEELLYTGAKVYLLERSSETRKTDYNLAIVDFNGTLVSIDSNLPNQIVRESIERGEIEEFKGLTIEKPEYTVDVSRIDFLLSGNSDKVLLEVKSCTLVRKKDALFPDAPTKRGSRHLQTLIKWLRRGRSAIFILIQRGDAEKFIPNESCRPISAHCFEVISLKEGPLPNTKIVSEVLNLLISS